ncbi:MAG TPA: hypothetical protein VI957_01745 [Candidatus Paceibacterota bacterium]
MFEKPKKLTAIALSGMLTGAISAHGQELSKPTEYGWCPRTTTENGTFIGGIPQEVMNTWFASREGFDVKYSTAIELCSEEKALHHHHSPETQQCIRGKVEDEYILGLNPPLQSERNDQNLRDGVIISDKEFRQFHLECGAIPLS